MNKLVGIIVMVILSLCVLQAVAAQSGLPEYQFAEGDWKMMGDRLYQMDTKEPLAKINIRAPQMGTRVYSFNVKYVGGAEDLHGGFGIHVFADSVWPRKSWGSGKSYLLWLNYDANPVSKDIPKGLSAQVYESKTHTFMELKKSIDLNKYAYLLNNLSKNVVLPIKLKVNGDTGLVKVYSPMDPNYYFKFYLGNTKSLRGNWVVLRTNSLACSFGM